MADWCGSKIRDCTRVAPGRLLPASRDIGLVQFSEAFHDDDGWLARPPRRRRIRANRPVRPGRCPPTPVENWPAVATRNQHRNPDAVPRPGGATIVTTLADSDHARFPPHTEGVPRLRLDRRSHPARAGERIRRPQAEKPDRSGRWTPTAVRRILRSTPAVSFVIMVAHAGRSCGAGRFHSGNGPPARTGLSRLPALGVRDSGVPLGSKPRYGAARALGGTAAKFPCDDWSEPACFRS